MAIKIGGNDVVDNNRKGIFQSANVGAFANPSRPGSAAIGDLIYSTTDGELQVWDGSAWVSAGGATEITSSGGTATFTNPNGTYRATVFTGPGTFVLDKPAYIDYLVVGGGGAGGVGNGYTSPVDSGGGGGGAGGAAVRYNVLYTSGSYPVTIGAGGGSYYFPPANPLVSGINATPGSPTTFGSVEAFGGGPGGNFYPTSPATNAFRADGQPGGCGGGSMSPLTGFPAPFIPTITAGTGYGGYGGVYGKNGGTGGRQGVISSPTSTIFYNIGGGGGGISANGQSAPGASTPNPTVREFGLGGNGYSEARQVLSGLESQGFTDSVVIENFASILPTVYGDSRNGVTSWGGGGQGGNLGWATAPQPIGGGGFYDSPLNNAANRADLKGKANTGGGGAGWYHPNPAPFTLPFNDNTMLSGGSGIVIIGYNIYQSN